MAGSARPARNNAPTIPRAFTFLWRVDEPGAGGGGDPAGGPAQAMTDLVTVLTERLRKIRMRCADCGELSHTEKECSEASTHTWETDDVAIARAALAFVAERLSTREEVAELLYQASPQTGRWPTWKELDRATALRAEWFTMADALLRDLRERLEVKG